MGRNGFDLSPPIFGTMKMNFGVLPVGTGSPAKDGWERLDLYLSPPDKWAAGKVVIVLRVSSSARTLRDKRMVITTFATAAATNKAADNASIPV